MTGSKKNVQISEENGIDPPPWRRAYCTNYFFFFVLHRSETAISVGTELLVSRFSQ